MTTFPLSEEGPPQGEGLNMAVLSHHHLSM
jgi:hypothetical protein